MVLWMQNAQASLAQQVNVWSVQNEPSNSTSYDSANYTPAQFISFVTGYLKPAMTSAGLTAKIATPEPSVWGGPSYFDPNWGSLSCRINPQWMPTWTSWSPTTMALTPVWRPPRKQRSSTTSPCGRRRFARAKLTTEASYNQALIAYNNSTWTYQIPKRVYAIGNFSRFMRPGSTVLTTTSSNSNLEATAVSPTSGKVALVLTNTSTRSITVTVSLANLANPPASVTPYRTSSTENQAVLSSISVAGGSFTITIPGSSIVTVVG